MEFKEPHLKDEFRCCPILLRIIVEDAREYSLTQFGKDFTITRILGRIKGDSGVHGDYRAVDVRDEHMGVRVFTDREVDELLGYVNRKYARRDTFKTLIHHSFNGGPRHFHFQIAALTTAYIRED